MADESELIAEWAAPSSYWQASCDFEFGGVKVKAGDVVPVHRSPWNRLLDYGQMYVILGHA